MTGLFKAKVEGLQELEVSLRQFSKSTQRRVLERALLKAAKPIEAGAERNAPVREGDLRASINTRVLRTNPGKTAFARAMADGASRQEAAAAARNANTINKDRGATVRVSASARHAAWVEFGTVKMAKQPFLGPAMRGGRDRALTTIKVELKRQIEATARRVAKRKAKAK